MLSAAAILRGPVNCRPCHRMLSPCPLSSRVLLAPCCLRPHRMGIANEKNYLKGAFPEGIALETAFVGPLLLSQLEAAVEDALSGGTWVDVAPLLPSVLTAADASALLSRVPQLQQAGAGGAGSAGAATGGKGSKGAAAAAAAAGGVAAGGQGAGAAARAPVVLAHTCVVSGKLVSDLQAEVDADARQAAEKALQERRAGPGQAQPAAAPQQVRLVMCWAVADMFLLPLRPAAYMGSDLLGCCTDSWSVDGSCRCMWFHSPAQ